jgi:hypothetical protein
MTELTDHELRAINLIITGLEPPQRDQMLAELAVAQIEVLIADRSLLRFRLPGHVPSSPGQAPLGQVCGQGGELLDFILYEDRDGRLFEIERQWPV